LTNGHLAVDAHGLTKRFGEFTAVDDISFQVQQGAIFGLLGPNGAGKTTTIRMTLGLLRPSSGTVDVLGVSVADAPATIRPRIGYMAQRFSLYDDLTVVQNLRFYGRAYGLGQVELSARIQDALESAGLEGREHIHTKDLSGGWRQRLALGAAILHQPELVFLDEPTAGVDPISRRAFWSLLNRLSANGITIFVTTHYMDEAEHCHHLAFMERGKLIAQGSPAEIKREAMHGLVIEIDCGHPNAAIGLLRQTEEFEEVSLFGAQIHIVAIDASSHIPRIKRLLAENAIEVWGLEVVEPSLDDVFTSIVRRSSGENS
jgi:ABC-2 type transport system ATP-binding protein